ncbi:MAG: ATP phosphoribosyltransferase regulatory subunit, partial [Candidatus Limnocylindria bacterium]
MRDGSRDLALPRGFRDILPTEARELHAIERSLMATFASFGYVPLEPPAVELAASAVTLDERRMLRFLDRDGRLLALRPDLTTAIARVVAQRYRDAEGALRLSYFTAVFREEPSMRGSEREYDQAGVELIGDGGARADAEVIALLASALRDCGLAAAEIDIGHVGFFAGFLSDLAPAAREAAT